MKQQFTAQRTLKESLEQNHVYIYVDFEEDYRCSSEEDIESAYWSQTQVTIEPVVAYSRQSDKLVHQSYVFVSDEPCHVARFVFALIAKLVPTLLELVPCSKFVHY